MHMRPPLCAGEPLPKLEVEAVRGVKGVKEATLTLPANDTTLKAGVAGKEVRRRRRRGRTCLHFGSPRGQASCQHAGEPAPRWCPAGHCVTSPACTATRPPVGTSVPLHTRLPAQAHACRACRPPCDATPPAPQIRVAVASGIGNARHLLQRIQAGEAHYDFVEVRCSGTAVQCHCSIAQPYCPAARLVVLPEGLQTQRSAPLAARPGPALLFPGRCCRPPGAAFLASAC